MHSQEDKEKTDILIPSSAANLRHACVSRKAIGVFKRAAMKIKLLLFTKKLSKMSYESEYNSHPQIEQLSDSSEDEEPEPRSQQSALRRNKKRHNKSKRTKGVPKDSHSLTRVDKYDQQVSEGPYRAAGHEQNSSQTSNGVTKTQQQVRSHGGEESLSVRLDLNLEAEVFLRAKIYGDVTLSLQ